MLSFLNLHSRPGHTDGFVLIHPHIVKDRIRDLRPVCLGDGKIPGGLAVVFPYVRFDGIPSVSDLFPDDVRESEKLLIHHAICPVDDGQLDGIVLVYDAGGRKLQLYPQILIQPGQTGSPAEVGIL